jgi:hypothetical protein
MTKFEFRSHSIDEESLGQGRSITKRVAGIRQIAIISAGSRIDSRGDFAMPVHD